MYSLLVVVALHVTDMYSRIKGQSAAEGERGKKVVVNVQ